MPIEISGNVSSVVQQPASAGMSSDMPASVVLSAKDQSPSKAELPGGVDTHAKDKVSFTSIPASVANIRDVNKPVGVVSHVVESYNFRGEIRIKFMDSRNRVVYQIPSEMAARMQDLMLKPNTSTDIKG